MNQAIGLKDLKFISNDYIIYKNGKDISGHCYGYLREIRIHKNRAAQELYKVSIYKRNTRRATRGKLIPTMQMSLVEQDISNIHLGNSDYGLILHLHNNSIEEITLKRYDNDTDTLFIKAPAKEVEQTINIPLPVHLTGLDALQKNGLIERYRAIVKEMEVIDKAPQAMSCYYLFLGKVQFQQGSYREAKEAFTQSIMILIFNDVKPGHEAYYWFGRVSEAEGNTCEAKTFYRLAMERYTSNAEFVRREEIIEALNR